MMSTGTALRVAAVLACAALLQACATGTSGTGNFAAAETIATSAERQIVVTVRNAPARTGQHAGSTAKGYDAAGRYQASPAAKREAAAIARRYGLRQVAAWPIEVLGVHCIVYEVPGERPLQSVLAQVNTDRRVESAQELKTFHAQATAGYDDPYLRLQGGVAAMQVEEAHRWSRGRGVRIAVIDSGIDDLHPDLASRIALVRDFTGLPTAARRLETHGTAVAGIIAADAGNGQGIIGIAPEAKLLALRACWQVGAESRCNTFTLAQAVAVAIAERADVLNLSLTGPVDPLLERLLRRAMTMGKVIVSAVPETGDARNSFPANLPGVIAVASAEVAHTGIDIEGELYAPGRNVLTLRPEGGFDFENGSSMAAASVSGIAALLIAAKGGVTASEIQRLLGKGAPHGELTGAGTGTDSGRSINACRALTALTGNGDCGAITGMHATRR